MTVRAVLLDAASRPRGAFAEVLDGLSADDANWHPAAGANSISWLAWHTGREIDVQLSALSGATEVWMGEGWFSKFALDLPSDAMGYGQSAEEAARVVVDDVDLLRGYVGACFAAFDAYLKGLEEASLGEVIDTRWDPPVTRGVRLVSIIDDAAQHVGQAAYVKGLLERR